MIVAVDFDGTLVEHRFPEIGRELPGAFAWLLAWQAAGAKLILWTMRSDMRGGAAGPDGPGDRAYLTEAVAFCRERGVEFWGVNANPQQKSWTTSPKVYARVYVDDAALGCPLVGGLPRASGVPDRPSVDWSRVGPAVLAMIEAEVGAR